MDDIIELKRKQSAYVQLTRGIINADKKVIDTVNEIIEANMKDIASIEKLWQPSAWEEFWSKYKWWILTGVVGVITVFAVWFLLFG